MHECVSVCVVYVCAVSVCVWVQTLMSTWRPEKDIRRPAVVILLLLRWGLSLNLELDWQPESSCLYPNSVEITNPVPRCLQGLQETEFRSLCLQASYLLTHVSLQAGSVLDTYTGLRVSLGECMMPTAGLANCPTGSVSQPSSWGLSLADPFL